MNSSDTNREQVVQSHKEPGVAGMTASQFLAGMTHEVRTTMHAVIGFSQMLEAEELTDEQQHYVGIIRNCAENVVEFVKDMMHLFSIETGKVDVEISDYSLERAFTVLESLMRPQAKEKGMTFEVRQCRELPAQIRTNSFLLHQCLANLVNNAFKFTKIGYVNVNVSLQHIEKKPYICFDVEDTGIGITADRQESVFEPSLETKVKATQRFSGTGLGLPITKKVANLLGGELTLTSEMDKGSVFSLIIPANIDVQ
ncbi:MAG: sensor histidine kinase [Planctomycetota bacterium]|jgi:signal transduction histidine kinase